MPKKSYKMNHKPFKKLTVKKAMPKLEKTNNSLKWSKNPNPSKKECKGPSLKKLWRVLLTNQKTVSFRLFVAREFPFVAKASTKLGQKLIFVSKLFLHWKKLKMANGAHRTISFFEWTYFGLHQFFLLSFGIIFGCYKIIFSFYPDFEETIFDFVSDAICAWILPL